MPWQKVISCPGRLRLLVIRARGSSHRGEAPSIARAQDWDRRAVGGEPASAGGLECGEEEELPLRRLPK